jgi:hypothetical protein
MRLAGIFHLGINFIGFLQVFSKAWWWLAVFRYRDDLFSPVGVFDTSYGLLGRPKN